MLETIPVVGLWPNIPLKNAGILMDPPTSDPIPIGDPPAANIAASPPDDPPGVRPTWYGLFVRPYTLLEDSIHMHNSDTLVTPIGIPSINWKVKKNFNSNKCMVRKK